MNAEIMNQSTAPLWFMVYPLVESVKECDEPTDPDGKDQEGCKFDQVVHVVLSLM